MNRVDHWWWRLSNELSGALHSTGWNESSRKLRGFNSPKLNSRLTESSGAMDSIFLRTFIIRLDLMLRHGAPWTYYWAIWNRTCSSGGSVRPSIWDIVRHWEKSKSGSVFVNSDYHISIFNPWQARYSYLSDWCEKRGQGFILRLASDFPSLSVR